MKTQFYMFIVLSAFAVSCSNTNRAYDTKESIAQIEDDLKAQFGEDAYFTNISVNNHKSNGNSINVEVTNNPASLKMNGWSNFGGSWKESSEITLEISGNAKAEEFMFQTDKIVDFKILGDVVEQAKQKVITEKKIEAVRVASIIIKAPSDGDFKDMKYYITITPKDGGSDFNFWYKMDGTLSNSDL